MFRLVVRITSKIEFYPFNFSVLMYLFVQSETNCISYRCVNTNTTKYQTKFKSQNQSVNRSMDPKLLIVEISEILKRKKFLWI